MVTFDTTPASHDPLAQKPLRELSDAEMDSIRQRLLKCAGDLEKSGVTDHEMRCAIYTKRKGATPLKPAGAEKPKTIKGEKAQAPKIDINNMLE